MSYRTECWLRNEQVANFQYKPLLLATMMTENDTDYS